jgi:hypothetical protein
MLRSRLRLIKQHLKGGKKTESDGCPVRQTHRGMENSIFRDGLKHCHYYFNIPVALVFTNCSFVVLSVLTTTVMDDPSC